jgi:hypothetical protein
MSSGKTRIVFSSVAIGIFLLGISPVGQAATAYLATGGGAFGTIDLNTGVFTQLGLTNNVPVAGLALVGSTLYANGQGTVGNSRGQLYSVNPATGALMSIGSPTGIDFTAFGSYGGTLYALDHTSANANLYSINPSTGAATLLGPTNTGQSLAGYFALSTNSTALYFSLNSNLYTLNTSTGQATVVGGLGGGIQVGAMAEVGGVLYGGQDSPQPPLKIVTLNKSTGVATFLSNVTNSPGSNASYVYALAPTIPIPNYAQILPQFCFGGGWYSALYFTNFTETAISFSVSFISDAGTPLAVPALDGSATNVSLGPHGTAIIEAPNVGSLLEGYAEFTLPTGVSGYGVFRQSVPGLPDQEAVVPFSNAAATSNTLTWDETAFTTGVAIVNPSSTATTVAVTVWDVNGNIIGTSSIPLPPNGKTEAAMRTLPGLGGMAGQRGSAQFTVLVGNVAVLGLRFGATAFTSIPATNPQ